MSGSPPPDARPTRRRRRRWPLLLLLLALLVLAGEVAVRSVRPDLDLMAMTGRRAGPHPMASWALVDAFAGYRGIPGFEQPVLGKSINDHGYMGSPDITFEKPEGVLRVAFLGGSSTSGQGFDLADAETWPVKVMQRLEAAHPDRRLEFINASLGGYSSFESLGRLWARVRFYDPDVVVVYHGWNEFYYWQQRLMDTPTDWRRHQDGDWRLDRFLPRSPSLSRWWIDPLFAWSQVFTRVRLKLARNLGGEVGGGGDEPLLDHYDRRGEEVWRTNLRLLRSVCDVIGAELFVAKQATLIVPELSEELRARCFYEHHGFDHDAHVEAYRALYRILDEEVPAERVIDVTPLNGRGDLFEDHVHPNARGADAIAEHVAGALLERSAIVGR